MTLPAALAASPTAVAVAGSISSPPMMHHKLSRSRDFTTGLAIRSIPAREQTPHSRCGAVSEGGGAVRAVNCLLSHKLLGQ